MANIVQKYFIMANCGCQQYNFHQMPISSLTLIPVFMDNTTQGLSGKREFNEFLLQARLRRLSTEALERFLSELKNIQDIPKNKTNFTSEIVSYYKIMKNNPEFLLKFGDFIRDYVLSAGESEYLIEVSDQEAFMRWISNWTDNTFIGKKFNFYQNVYLELGEKYLNLDESPSFDKKNTVEGNGIVEEACQKKIIIS
jgi:hypothetical protein